jgi:uncharacterized protein (TIGR02145 family)
MTVSSGASATLHGAVFPLGVSQVTVIAYRLTNSDTCEFTVTVLLACPTSTMDSELNTYKVTRLAGLCWTENLRSTIYSSDGVTPIEWANLYPGADVDIFGLLYTWYSAVGIGENSSNLPIPDINGFVQGICPTGYHLPSQAEWNLQRQFSAEDIKSKYYWVSPLGSGNDKYFWDARPAGRYKGEVGRFIDLYGFAGWWAWDTTPGLYANYTYLAYFCNDPLTEKTLKIDGLSVRCIWNGLSPTPVQGQVNCDGKPLLFMTFNLGAGGAVRAKPAEQQALHTNPEDTFGDYYQWGRKSDGHEKTTSSTIWGPITIFDANGQPTGVNAGHYILTTDDWRSPKSDILWGKPKTVNDPCPSGWRVPTDAEWQSVINENTWTYLATPNPGYKISPDGGTTTTLFLPITGWRDISTNVIRDVGYWGCYWCSTTNGADSYYLDSLGGLNINSDKRGYGMTVRCIAE